MLEQMVEAVINNDASEVKRFLDKGVDPNSKVDDMNVSLLHFAAQNNAIKVMPLLIKAGGNIYATHGYEEQTPLDIAYLHNNQEAVQLLISYMMHSVSDNVH